MGLPVVGWIINPVTVFIAYAFGCLRFASGFRRTSYNGQMGKWDKGGSSGTQGGGWAATLAVLFGNYSSKWKK